MAVQHPYPGCHTCVSKLVSKHAIKCLLPPSSSPSRPVQWQQSHSPHADVRSCVAVRAICSGIQYIKGPRCTRSSAHHSVCRSLSPWQNLPTCLRAAWLHLAGTLEEQILQRHLCKAALASSVTGEAQETVPSTFTKRELQALCSLTLDTSCATAAAYGPAAGIWQVRGE